MTLQSCVISPLTRMHHDMPVVLASGFLAALAAHLAYGGVLGFVYSCLFRARCLQSSVGGE